MFEVIAKNNSLIKIFGNILLSHFYLGIKLNVQRRFDRSTINYMNANEILIKTVKYLHRNDV